MADLSTAEGIAEASAILERDEPDILINMAGTQYFGPAEGQSLEAMLASYMVNLVAPAALCRAALGTMKRRNSRSNRQYRLDLWLDPLCSLCGLFKR